MGFETRPFGKRENEDNKNLPVEKEDEELLSDSPELPEESAEEKKDNTDEAGEIANLDSEYAEKIRKASSEEEREALVAKWSEEYAMAKDGIQEQKPEYSAFERNSEDNLEKLEGTENIGEAMFSEEISLMKDFAEENIPNINSAAERKGFFEKHPKLVAAGVMLMLTTSMVLGKAETAQSADWSDFWKNTGKDMTTDSQRNSREKIKLNDRLMRINDQIGLVEKQKSRLFADSENISSGLKKAETDLMFNKDDRDKRVLENKIRRLEGKISGNSRRVDQLNSQIDRLELQKRQAIRAYDSRRDQRSSQATEKIGKRLIDKLFEKNR